MNNYGNSLHYLRKGLSQECSSQELRYYTVLNLKNLNCETFNWMMFAIYITYIV